MAPTDPITVTRDELVAAFREWETKRRLHPGEFSPRFEDETKDVDEIAEALADTLARYLAAGRATTFRVDFAVGGPVNAGSAIVGETGPEEIPARSPWQRLVAFREDLLRELETCVGPGDFDRFDRIGNTLRRLDALLETLEPILREGRRIEPPMTAEVAADEARKAIRKGDLDHAAAWTDLVRALS